MSNFSTVSPLNNDPSVLSKGCFAARYFFPMMQWCNTHLLWHLCWERHFLEGPFPSNNSCFSLTVPLMAWMPVNYVLGLASWQRPNKVGVMIGMDSHAWKKQVLFIGSLRCAHSFRSLRLVEGRHHCSGRKLLMPGMFVGMGWPRQREGRVKGEEGAAENRPPGSGASKAGLTESIWTTVNRRQPVCWLPLSCIFTGSFPTNTHHLARLSKGASARVFPPSKGDFYFYSAQWKEKVDQKA